MKLKEQCNIFVQNLFMCGLITTTPVQHIFLFNQKVAPVLRLMYYFIKFFLKKKNNNNHHGQNIKLTCFNNDKFLFNQKKDTDFSLL